MDPLTIRLNIFKLTYIKFCKKIIKHYDFIIEKLAHFNITTY